MSPRGLLSMHASMLHRVTTEVQQRYDRAPELVRQSFIPFALASLPLVVTTACLPRLLAPLAMLLAIVLLYEVARFAESAMFAVGKLRSHLAVTMPLCGFVSAWGLALAMVGRPYAMLSVVGPFSLLLLLACAPAFRLREARTTRRIPLRYSFPVLAAIAWLASFQLLARS